MASYDEQITRLDRDGCCRPSPAYFKERQLTKRVAVAECGQRDVTIFRRDKPALTGSPATNSVAPSEYVSMRQQAARRCTVAGSSAENSDVADRNVQISITYSIASRGCLPRFERG